MAVVARHGGADPRAARAPRPRAPSRWSPACAQGLAFLFTRPIFLGAMTLDLFAVLFGGAVAILPIFAEEILHVGPQGLGALRAAPAVGAVLMSGLLALRPPPRRAGPTFLCGGRRVRRLHDRLRAVALVLAVAVAARGQRRGRHAERLLPQHADAGAGAVGDARAGLGGEPDLHRLVERDRRLRIGRRGAPARRPCRRWSSAASITVVVALVTAWRVPALRATSTASDELRRRRSSRDPRSSRARGAGRDSPEIRSSAPS